LVTFGNLRASTPLSFGKWPPPEFELPDLYMLLTEEVKTLN